ncbi:outer membrane protein OmpK [Hydrocarboniphaga effusa]|jgi:nucleoside-specific outer membrane channel protein Tsx|uniref:outer membrane protein OmpK n=1 Tax=Hydrocarboniphaga effusa TaxID=243629 RepID=UPI0035B1A727
MFSKRLSHRVSCSLGAALLAVAAPAAHAGSALFGTTNVQYLYGTTYADFNDDFSGYVHDDKASIITLEHFDVWKYGDNFFFVDITNPDREGDRFASADKGTGAYYAELSPRLSIGKILDTPLAFGPIVDFLVTTTLEIPGNGVEQTYLYGLAADLKIPGFQFFQFNWYLRNAQDSDLKTGQQITLAWGAPFKIGNVAFSFEGFFDYAWGEDPKTPGGSYQDNIITAPRFLIDVGSIFGAPGNFQAGVEYQIWRNKYGIDGMNEDVAQAMVKWIIQ